MLVFLACILNTDFVLGNNLQSKRITIMKNLIRKNVLMMALSTLALVELALVYAATVI